MLDAAAIIEIHQLLGRYGHCIDHRRWDDFADLFTPDATIDYAGGTGTVLREGRDAVVAWFRELGELHPPAHHVTNIVVDDRADPSGPVDVHSKFLAPFSREVHEPKRLYGGDYHDVVVSEGGCWRFSHKACRPRWSLTVVVDDDAPDHRRTF